VGDVLCYLLDNFPDQVILIDETTKEHAVVFTVVHSHGGARHEVEVNDAFIDEFDNCAVELQLRRIIELMSRNKTQRVHITVGKESVMFAAA
jgi:hypothetical protein